VPGIDNTLRRPDDSSHPFPEKVAVLPAWLNRKTIIVVVILSGTWGLMEALIGELLFANDIPYASVYLSVIGFVVLGLAHGYMGGRLGIATLIAALAMIYKFLNAPFFGCHLIGILGMGVAWDLFFGVLKVQRAWLGSALAAYLDFALFAVLATYVFRYEAWARDGFGRGWHHILVSGSLTAVGSALLVPAAVWSGVSLRLREQSERPVPLPVAFGAGVVGFVSWAYTVIGAVAAF
jgi:hypothetical protein